MSAVAIACSICKGEKHFLSYKSRKGEIVHHPTCEKCDGHKRPAEDD